MLAKIPVMMDKTIRLLKSVKKYTKCIVVPVWIIQKFGEWKRCNIEYNRGIEIDLITSMESGKDLDHIEGIDYINEKKRISKGMEEIRKRSKARENIA